MWKALAGKDAMPAPPPVSGTTDDDNWETEADFVNDIDEKSSRWGAKTVNSSGHQGSVSLDTLRNDVLRSDLELKQKQMEHMPKASLGYGGKFGVETDRIDKVAETWDYKGTTEKHASQKDYSQGFGGKFGVQQDRQDKSAVGWGYKDNLAKHDSQKDHSVGFGGKFGVQTDRQDKSAAGWEYKEKLQTHESQRDYAVGFGGKYGVQKDRQDKSAVGWEYKENLQIHESQKDYSKGFGGKYGVETEKQDKSAVGWEYKENLQIHESQKDYSKGFGGKYGVEKEKQDKSAVGWEYKGDVPLHHSQKDHAVGFGGKFGVQSDRKDKSAVGYDYQESLSKHESQLLTKETVPVPKKPIALPKEKVYDENAHSDGQKPNIALDIEKGRASDLKSKFEQLTMKTPETEMAKAQEVRASRRAQMIKENTAELQGEDRPSRPEELNLTERLTEENDRATARTENVLKSPVTPGQLSSSKVAHELMGRFITHPEMKQHRQRPQSGSDDDWSTTDHTMKSESDHPEYELPINGQQISPLGSGDEKPRELRSIVNNHQELESTVTSSLSENLIVEQNGNQENVIHYQEDNVNYNINNNNNNYNEDLDKSGRLADVEPDVKDHPLAPPAHPMADTNVRAVALYDYEAAADDEISFEPDDIITNIEMVDPGWWRGQCKGAYGLFPANYVELMPS